MTEGGGNKLGVLNLYDRKLRNVGSMPLSGRSGHNIGLFFEAQHA